MVADHVETSVLALQVGNFQYEAPSCVIFIGSVNSFINSFVSFNIRFYVMYLILEVL